MRTCEQVIEFSSVRSCRFSSKRTSGKREREGGDCYGSDDEFCDEDGKSRGGWSHVTFCISFFLFHFYWSGERGCERAGTVFIIRQGTFRVHRSLCLVNVGMMGETHAEFHTLFQTDLTQPHRNMHKHQGNDRCLVLVVRVTVNNAEILALILIVSTLLPSFLLTICHPSLQPVLLFLTSLGQFSHADFFKFSFSFLACTL